MSFTYLKEIKIYKRKGYNLSLKVKVSNDNMGWRSFVKTFETEKELDEHFKNFIQEFSSYDFVVLPFSQAERVLKLQDDIDSMLIAIKKGIELYYLKDKYCYVSKHIDSDSFSYRYYFKFNGDYKETDAFLFTKEEAEKVSKNLKRELELIPKTK